MMIYFKKLLIKISYLKNNLHIKAKKIYLRYELARKFFLFLYILFSLKGTFQVIFYFKLLELEYLFTNLLKNNKLNKRVKLIAFFLPQFHSIPENDKWWGKGFTDWDNVKKAKPLFNNFFKKHFQPQEPTEEIGWYNLLDPVIQKKQVALAKKYGIYGFCFYHYWFDGKKLLEKPVESFIRNKDLAINFCLCWANEPWTRRWDGLEQNILQPQNYSNKDGWITHFKYLLTAFKDERYIKIDDKPIIIIYRIGHIKNFNNMISCWRRLAKEKGLNGIYIIAARGGFRDSINFDNMNIDAIHDFAPNCLLWEKFIKPLHPLFYKDDPLQKYDYDSAWQSLLKIKQHFPVHFRGAFVSFDNTPRMPNTPVMIYGANPHKFKIYLRKQIKQVINDSNKEKFIFINAWNEWGEGAYLEPDKRFGRGYLKSVKRALALEEKNG